MQQPSDYNSYTYGSCTFFGSSDFSYSPVNISTSKTGKQSGTCNDQFHVHAYFYYDATHYIYDEKTDYANTNILVYVSGTPIIAVWGYHRYPSPYNEIQTHAY